MRTNHATVTSHLHNSDILLLQEHWLLAYEKDEIYANLKEWEASVRSVDDNDLELSVLRHQGFGGTATMWKQHLNPYIKTTDEGNERILPVFLETRDQHFCIINCYLPSGNSREALDKFSTDLSILHSLLVKYASSHEMVITGDLNLDILNRNGPKEKQFRQLMADHQLKPANTSQKDKFTFNHKSFHANSHLDYFIVPTRWHNFTIGILDDIPHNTSAHHPVTLEIRTDNPKAEKSSKITTKKKVKWDKGDPQAYQKELGRIIHKQDFQNISIEGAVEALNQAILKAEKATFPATKSKVIKRPHKIIFRELAAAIANSKEAHFHWKNAGKPEKNHPISRRRAEASKNVRSVQRQHEAERRNSLFNDIIISHERDQATFFRLLRKRHGPRGREIALRLNGELVYDPPTQLDAWANYYEHLATPEPDRNNGHDILATMRWICKQEGAPTITHQHIHEAIKQLNSGKAADLFGLQAEHYKLGGAAVVEAVTLIVRRIFEETRIPDSAKTGFKIPIPKRGKDALEMSNHRGITITSTLGKIIEHVIQFCGKPTLGGQISDLQYGFELGKSPTMATVCLTEALAESQATGKSLYVATLDAQKAFDVVDQAAMKTKLFYTGIKGNTWTMIDTLYDGVQEMVRWKGKRSRPYPVNQGVRQGGVLSTTLYKEYVNPLLSSATSSRVGMSIGSSYIGTPTCADDILLISNSRLELQEMLTTAYKYSKENFYTIHPGKSTVTPLYSAKDAGTTTWFLGDEEMPTTQSFTHLGLTWNQQSPSPATTEKITLARRTAYMLIGKGINGTDGINPVISAKVVETQILPRMTHGLEAVYLRKKDLDNIDRAHRELLRQYQSLPERTAIPAIYLLTATFPASVHIEYKTLLLYGAICRLTDENPLHQLAIRQLSSESTSWSMFVRARDIALKYDIDLVSQWHHPWNKITWKQYIRESIFGPNHTSLIRQAMDKTSLKWLDIKLCQRGEAHPIWKSSTYSIINTKRASIRARLLCGTYLLQDKIQKLNQGSDATCTLCQKDEETVYHFLLHCPFLKKRREEALPGIIQMLEQVVEGDADDRDLVKAILNGGIGGVPCNQEWIQVFNNKCNTLVDLLHRERSTKINELLLLRKKVVP